MSHQRILVVDDVPENLGTLYAFLSKRGFKVVVAPDGESALRMVGLSPPDLILLDAMMPGIGGFETCLRLQRDPATRGIPVIFMTALSDPLDKVRGLEAGAVDYVTKPIEQEEVLSRIRTHLTILALRRELQARNAELEAKNRELLARNEDLDAFARTVAHDLKNPLGIITNANCFLRQCVASPDPDDADELMRDIAGACERMSSTIDGLMALAGVAHRPVRRVPLDLRGLIECVRQGLSDQIGAAGARVEIAPDWPRALGDPQLIELVLANYLGNAIKYGGNPPRIAIGHDAREGKLRLWVEDNGPGLSQEEQGRLFTPFTRLHKVEADGYGIGLSIVERVAARLGESAGVEGASGQGSRFWFTLPRCAIVPRDEEIVPRD